jgi:hypothetical protein
VVGDPDIGDAGTEPANLMTAYQWNDPPNTDTPRSQQSYSVDDPEQSSLYLHAARATTSTSR